MAGLRGRLTGPALALALATLALATAAADPLLTEAADPTPSPRPQTCAERFPDEGPGGVDLRLGCIVSELVGLYAAGQAGPPPTLSTYAIGLVTVVALIVAVSLLAVRLLARRAASRLAPVVPAEWWLCPSCRSVNAVQAIRCYRCGSPRAGGPRLPTDDAPATPQSFGRGKHG